MESAVRDSPSRGRPNALNSIATLPYRGYITDMAIFLVVLLLPVVALADPGLTIYNQNFAVVRDAVPLDLQSGENRVVYEGATIHLEPDSVMLRDAKTGQPLNILEQNYRNDPISQELLLSVFEGQTIDFLIREANKPDRVVKGKILRSGYVPHNAQAMRRYGNQYAMGQMAMSNPNGAGQPIIEVDGTIRFGLPGQPIFPSLGSDSIRKPQLNWLIRAAKAATLEGELSYITGGLSWEASYNVVAPEQGDQLDLVGWVTIDNQSGRDFTNAKTQLMAGDVNKLAPPGMVGFESSFMARGVSATAPQVPAVSERTFDEYHLYTLERSTTLRDRETKQVEFVRAAGVDSRVLYVYDGLKMDWNQFRGADARYRRTNEEFGAQSQTKVAVMREFKNTKANQLGIPLPAGRVRFYRRDGGALQFTGENRIDHTPADETVRIYTGDAFDLVGSRKRTAFQVDSSNNWARESFEITLRNRKKEAVEILVVEHLFRWSNWEITEKSDTYRTLKSDEIEFRVSLKPGEERTITYTVHYSW